MRWSSTLNSIFSTLINRLLCYCKESALVSRESFVVEKVALFIDAENISYRYLPHLLEEISYHGKPVLKVAYGNWETAHLQTWCKIADELNIKLRHQTSAVNTKNATDMRLIMDAMEVLHYIDIDAFCIASNDADYVPLCHKVHETKKRVIGAGYRHASEALIRACDTFIFIKSADEEVHAVPQLDSTKSEQTQPIPRPIETPKKALQNEEVLVIQAIQRATAGEKKWVPLSTLGNTLREIQSDFQSKRYGYATLSELLRSIPHKVELNNNAARLKNNAPMQKSRQQHTKKTDLEKLIAKAFAKVPNDDDGWVSLSALGSALRQIETNFSAKKHGHATLSKLLKSMPKFISLRTDNKTMYVRLN